MKKLLTIISLVLVLTMLPLSLFSCDSQPAATSGTSGTEASTEGTTDTSATTQGTTDTEDTADTSATTQGTTDTQATTEGSTDTQATTQGTTEGTTDTQATTEGTQSTENNNDQDNSNAELTDKTYYFEKAEDLAHFKRIGRTVVADGGLCCDYVGTGVEFTGTFVGEVTIKITVEKVAGQESRYAGCYFTVYIDGVRVEDFYDDNGNRIEGAARVFDGTEEIPLAYFGNPGKHTIRIVKQTGPRNCLACFEELIMTGELTEKPADKDLYIEFIGDSITSGQGTAGVKGAENLYNGTNVTDYSDGTKTYAYLTAKEFDADYSIISESAIAMDGSWFGGRTIFDHYNSYSHAREHTKGDKYSFDFENARVPDLVVINLGTNDSALTNNPNTSHPTTPEKVNAAVKKFISLIREKYGDDVSIVYASGMLGNSGATWNAIYSALDELGGIYKVTLPGDAAGQSDHPSAAAHENAGNTLINFIKDNNLLG